MSDMVLRRFAPQDARDVNPGCIPGPMQGIASLVLPTNHSLTPIAGLIANMRDYVIKHRRMANIDENVNGEDYLAKQFIEEHEMIDIGLLDSEGNSILARKRMDPVGYVHHKVRD